MKNLDTYIEDLLFKHQCVIIPEFGAFVSNRKAAELAADKSFSPPQKELTFNSRLTYNDGLVAKHISEVERSSYEEAQEYIKSVVTRWKQELSLGQEVRLANIGKFTKGTDNNIIFTSLSKENYLTDSFGMSPVTTKEVSKGETGVEVANPIYNDQNNKPGLVENPSVTPEEAAAGKPKPKMPLPIKYAAVAIVGLSAIGYAVYSLMTNQENPTVVQVEPDPAKVEELVNQEVAKATYVPEIELTATAIKVTKDPVLVKKRKEELKKQAALEAQREKERTGIKGLKIKYNKVFGYFIEVTKANEHLVPEDYIRKQTLVNSERYIVPDLKEYEEKVITAKSKIEALEYELFKQLTSEIKEHIDSLYKLANRIANLDIVSNFAHIATKNSYVKPEMNEGEILEIKGGRHPIVETLIPSGTYVKNDIILDDKNNLIILTGPNMSGKSTYMKQVALNIIMAHIGSYVAADYAKIPIVDKIFTRVGASDDLLTGQSTFMLEMTEVASILNSATKKSFVVLDEIGRGTSTYDGISIATAITEYIHNVIGAKTIFATHYHELTELEKELERAINFRVEVKEDGKNVIFLREIVKGGADKSYGIEVARLSGVPKEVLNRSRKILKKLETRKNLIENKIKAEQMMLFGTGFEEDFEEEETEILSENEVKVLDILKNMDLNSMSPLESLLKLNELKKILIGGTDE